MTRARSRKDTCGIFCVIVPSDLAGPLFPPQGFHMMSGQGRRGPSASVPGAGIEWESSLPTPPHFYYTALDVLCENPSRSHLFYTATHFGGKENICYTPTHTLVENPRPRATHPPKSHVRAVHQTPEDVDLQRVRHRDWNSQRPFPRR